MEGENKRGKTDEQSKKGFYPHGLCGKRKKDRVQYVSLHLANGFLRKNEMEVTVTMSQNKKPSLSPMCSRLELFLEEEPHDPM